MKGEKLLVQRLELPGDNVIDPKKYITVTPGGLLEKNVTLAAIISKGIQLVFFAAGLILFGYLLYGGFKYLTSLGDEAAIEEAKGTITYALIGFFIIFSAYFITLFFGRLFGIEIF